MSGERDQFLLSREAEPATILFGEAEAMLDEELTTLPPARAPTRRATLLALSLLAVAATVLAFLSWTTDGSGRGLLTHVSSRPSLVEFEEEEPGLCDSLPYLKILKLKSSNLGGHGPNKSAEEGLIYETTASHLGLGNITDVELHLHVVSGEARQPAVLADVQERQLGGHGPNRSAEERLIDETTASHRGLGSITDVELHFHVVSGTNVTLQVHGYDPVAKEDLLLPKAAVTFFDLDTGMNGNFNVEYDKVDNTHSIHFLTKETEVKVSHGEGGTTFDPLSLTAQQDNRAFSLMFEKAKDVTVQFSVSPGKTAHAFSFVLRPALRCVSTVPEDGTVLDAKSTDSPITVMLVLELAMVGSPGT